jgi:hypothetical protein
MAGKAKLIEREADKAKTSKKKAGTPEGSAKTKARQAQPTREHRPSPKKCSGQPHPEVPPRKRPLKAPTLEPEPEQAQGQAHVEPASAGLVITQGQALQELVKRASDGNEHCLQGLRDLLDNNPSIWQAAGNVATLAEKHWVEVLANGNALVQEAIPRRVIALKSLLLGRNPTPLERLLVDVIAVSFLASEHGEISASRADGSCQQIASRLRRAESGQRRLLSAVKTLAVVRALLGLKAP